MATINITFKNFENKVFVTKCGIVLDMHLNRLVPEFNKDKRAYVQINNVGFELFYIDTLVARMFVKNKDQTRTPYLIHLDGDLQNNNADNLKWVDADEFAHHITIDNTEEVQSNEDIIEYNDQLETKYNELVKKYNNVSKTLEQREEENKKLKTELKNLRVENANQLADIGNYSITVVEQAKRLEQYEQIITKMDISSIKAKKMFKVNVHNKADIDKPTQPTQPVQQKVQKKKEPKMTGITAEYDLVDEPKEIKYGKATYFITPNGNIRNKYRGQKDVINIDDKNVCPQAKKAVLSLAFFAKNKKRTIYDKVNYLLNLSVMNMTIATEHSCLTRGYAVYKPVNATKSNTITYTVMKNGQMVYSTNIYAELVANLFRIISNPNRRYTVTKYWISQQQNISKANNIWYIRIIMPDGAIITKCPKQYFDKWEVSLLDDDYMACSIKDCITMFDNINKQAKRDLINTNEILKNFDEYILKDQKYDLSEEAKDVILTYLNGSKDQEQEPVKEISQLIKKPEPIKIKDANETLNNFQSSFVTDIIKLDIAEKVNNAELIHARRIRNSDIPESYKACRNGHIVDIIAHKYLTEYIKKNDYYVFVEIGGKEYRVDKLIAEAYYVGKDRADKIKNWVVIHTNKNLMDNRRDNLEYKPKEEANRYLPDLQKIKA